MNDLQLQVQEAIDGLVESGAERGLQVAVYRHGEQVVDAVAGVADPESGRAVTPETPFYAISTGKGMTSTVAHVLVERGLFGYDTRISELWPEFRARGKENATVRHALTHTVGVPAIPAAREGVVQVARRAAVDGDGDGGALRHLVFSSVDLDGAGDQRVWPDCGSISCGPSSFIPSPISARILTASPR